MSKKLTKKQVEVLDKLNNLITKIEDDKVIENVKKEKEVVKD